MASQKTVLFVNYSLGMGGIETLVLEISKRIDKSRFSPVVCSLSQGGSLEQEFKANGIPVFNLPKKEGIDAGLVFRLAKEIKERGVSVVHSQNHSSWLYSAAACFIAGVPLVHTAHTTADYSGANVRRWLELEKILAFFTRKIVVVAARIGCFMREKQGISAGKIELIHNGIESSKYAAIIDRAAKRKEVGLGSDDFVVGNVARFYPNKDHFLLLEAAKLACAGIQSFKLLIVGDGPLKSRIEEKVRELGLEHKVVMPGNRRDIPELLKCMDVFALSSKREGLPVALLEAMSAGVPVAATDVDGNGELVKNGETGILVPYADAPALSAAMIQFYSDKAFSAGAAASAHRLVSADFSFKAMVEKYQDVYEKALNAGK